MPQAICFTGSDIVDATVPAETTRYRHDRSGRMVMVNVLDSRFVSERIFEGGTEIKELSGRRRLG